MKRVCMYLPPFAGDYSGVCSALFDFGGMLCIHDAAGCTGNYTGFDEPRWYGSEAMVFCTGLRRMDAIMGNEEKVLQRIIAAAEEKKPAFIAIVGSPVPLIIGFDFQGVAKEITARTGIPAFGFDTAGISGSYKDGIVMGLKAMLEYFMKPADGIEEKTVNIIGMTPLDMEEENLAGWKRVLIQNGYRISAECGMGGNLEQLAQLTQGEVNLVGSQAGGILARYLYEKNGIPYLEGIPLEENFHEEYIRALKKVRKSRQPMTFQPEEKKNIGQKKACIIHDAVMAASIGNVWRRRGIEAEEFTLFGEDAVSRALHVKGLADEDEIIQCVNSEQYDFVVADPLILELVERKEVCKIEMPHYAVSSKICRRRGEEIK